MPKVKVNGINIYYEIHGEGEPLLLITGLSADITSWAFQTHEFAQKYKVIVFDNRGVGQTDTPDIPYTAEMMADDTAGLLQALDIPAAHILGLSLGSFIAQEIAIKYPEKVKSLILAGSASQMPARTKFVEKSWGTLLQKGADVETFYTIMFPYMWTNRVFDNPDHLQMLMDGCIGNPYPQPTHAFLRQLDVCLAHDTRDRLSQISAKTLVLVGSEEILLPVEVSERLSKGISNSKLVVLEGGGHGFMVEISDKVNSAVLEFLDEVS